MFRRQGTESKKNKHRMYPNGGSCQYLKVARLFIPINKTLTLKLTHAHVHTHTLRRVKSEREREIIHKQ